MNDSCGCAKKMQKDKFVIWVLLISTLERISEMIKNLNASSEENKYHTPSPESKLKLGS